MERGEIISALEALEMLWDKVCPSDYRWYQSQVYDAVRCESSDSLASILQDIAGVLQDWQVHHPEGVKRGL